MLIVLTSERVIEQEADWIHQLFTQGLALLHLRKPSFDEAGYRQLLKQIDPQFYKRIMLHQYPSLCKEFNLRGVHLQEQARRDLGTILPQYVSSFSQAGYQVSSSFHTPEEIKTYGHHFEYVLLSPVFSSISKAGYMGKGFDVTPLPHTVIGMGGINEQTVSDAKALGYAGVGVLGGIWNTSKYVESYLAIQGKVNEVYA